MEYIQFSEEEKVEFFDEIASHFYKANFGQMSKADIESEVLKTNTELAEENAALKEEKKYHQSIVDQNEKLKSENSQLLHDLKDLQDKYDIISKTNIPSISLNSDNSVDAESKISIFNLDTFQGESRFGRFFEKEDNYIDMYGNKYLTGYLGANRMADKDSKYAFTYLLNNQYSRCEGKMAWSKVSKNAEGSAWVEFYSGDKLIYKTDEISAGSKPLEFSFDVEGIETLTKVVDKPMHDL